MTSTSATPQRVRNPRGHGDRLRGEVVASAGRMLEQGGGSDAVTLRGIAREIGVAAPSIYAHFRDRDAIIAAVVDEGFVRLRHDVIVARAAAVGPVGRLLAGCRAYLKFAWARPSRYTAMFGGSGTARSGSTSDAAAEGPAAAAFGLLADAITECVNAGRSTSPDPMRAATAVLVALHGYALLRPQHTTFTWPANEEMIKYLVTALAGIRTGDLDNPIDVEA